jgi:molybdate transport system substrate-binding protein
MVELRLLSTLGIAGVMEQLGPALEAGLGIRIAATFMPTLSLLQRIRAGETGDLAVLTADGLDELVASGAILSRTDLARSFVGFAVRAGAPHPDISTQEAVVATLRATPSIALSRAGASGIFFQALLERLGIADEVRAKATVIPSGFTAELVARGEVALAVQQVSELMVVPGIEVVGRLPPGIEGIATFSAGVFATSRHPGPAAALIAALAGTAHARVYRDRGLEPASTGGPFQA